jgi:phenylacetate-CoA ligase
MPLKSIVLDGEILTPKQAQWFAEYWGSSVINGYGLTEVGVVGFGRHGCTALHLNWLNVYAEIVDPDSGQPADEGELVVTSLDQEAMPLLRGPRSQGPVLLRSCIPGHPRLRTAR